MNDFAVLLDGLNKISFQPLNFKTDAKHIPHPWCSKYLA
jgi:hypothetical protein